jgi:hypothetical protein
MTEAQAKKIVKPAATPTSWKSEIKELEPVVAERLGLPPSAVHLRKLGGHCKRSFQAMLDFASLGSARPAVHRPTRIKGDNTAAPRVAGAKPL